MSEVGGPFQSHEDLEGKVLQGYRLIRLIGKGGMAWVYRGEHARFKESLAVKVLRPHLADDEEVRARFLEEAKIQFKLRHPNIIQVSDIVDEGRIFGFVMEWAEGRNLKQVLKRLERPASRKDIWRVMGPVIDAVGYAHQEGVVHRDIKPANIMLHHTPTGEIVPKVADFGIAKALDEEEGKTGTGITMGTLKYMPPEQVRDAKRVDHRADIYALGVTLFMMATLRAPFEGRQEFVVYQQMNEDPPPPSQFNPSLSPAFDRVLQRALAREAEDRFQSCAEFGHALSLALLDPEQLHVDLGELDTHKIYNMLAELPEEHSIYQTDLTPLSPGLVQQLYRSHTADTITKLHQFVVHGEGEGQTPLPHKALESAAAPAPEGEPVPDETVVSQPSYAAPSATTNHTILAVIIGVLLSLLLVTGGLLAYTFRAELGQRLGWGAKAQVTKTNCQEGTERLCYTGSDESRGKGSCKAGKQTCRGGAWGSCQGQVLPAKEVCDGKDNDCNGKVDESFTEQDKPCQVQESQCLLPGKQVCLKGKVACKPDTKALASSDRYIRLSLAPGKGQYRVRIGRKWMRTKQKACFQPKYRSTRLSIRRRGYYTCVFRLRKKRRAKPVKVLMRRRGGMALDPPPSYCLRR